MAVNKVVMNTENGEQILVDLTGDSVTPETLAEGATAHDASGNMIVGEMQTTTPTTAVLYTEQTLTDAQKAQARKNIGLVGGGSGDNIIVDAELSETSENPIQNKAVAKALKNISSDITVDSELSLESENPVQNKAVTHEFKAFNEAAGEFNRRLTTLEQLGVGGGGEYEIPTFNLAEIGLPAITIGGDEVVLETDTTEIMAALGNGAVKFTVGLNIGMEVQVDVVMNSIGVQGEYICAYALDFGEPFILTLAFANGGIQGYLAQIVSGTTEPPTAIDISGLDTNGTIVETYTDGTSKTTTIEFDANGTPTKITDGDGNVTTLIW